MTPTRTRRSAAAVLLLATAAVAVPGIAAAQAPPIQDPPPTTGPSPGALPVSQAPQVSLTGPAEGATTSEATVSVAGSVRWGLPIRSLTVNGQPVQLGGGGTFAVTVPLNVGANTIAVQATDLAGRSGSAAVSVVRTAVVVTAPAPVPARTCTVPRLRGRTLAGARSALTRSSCRLGTVRRERSASVARGRVMRQSVAQGRIVPAGTKVTVTLSRGRTR
jgi:hypothetical protein